MKTILIVGSGGREHALAWQLARSPAVEQVLCAPGNPGIAQLAECVPVKADDCTGLVALAQARHVDLVVIGPELPLSLGLVDALERVGVQAFGPTQAASRIETSKAFAKEFMLRWDIPTGAGQVATTRAEALRIIHERGAPIVVKADGLAGGKGVTVARTVAEAEAAVEQLMSERVFGVAGETVVLEDALDGIEATVMAVTDGEHIVPLAPARDYKRLLDGDAGPQTGGMGAYSPHGALTPELEREVLETILKPTVRRLAQTGTPFRGVLYAGLMLTKEGPRVMEFNARLGDPEAQVVLPRLATDLMEVCEACLAGRLQELTLRWRKEAALCVVLASPGYPDQPETGQPIAGLMIVESMDKILVFHAGTADHEGTIRTAGGRVLGVTALGGTLATARTLGYKAVGFIQFEGRQFRQDIALTR